MKHRRSTFEPTQGGHLDIQVTPLGCLFLLTLPPIAVGAVAVCVLIIRAVTA